MIEREELLSLSTAELGELLADGYAIDPEELDDTEYRGVSLGLPGVVERLTWKTFQKVFHRDPATGELRGWNVRVEQRGIDAPSVPLLRNERPITWGHYEVVSLDGVRLPRRCGPGLLLDYGRGGNGMLDPVSRVRDPVVAIDEGSCQRLLGWSYLDLGAMSVVTPSFFLLERERSLTHVVAPPRR